MVSYLPLDFENFAFSYGFSIRNLQLDFVKTLLDMTFKPALLVAINLSLGIRFFIKSQRKVCNVHKKITTATFCVYNLEINPNCQQWARDFRGGVWKSVSVFHGWTLWRVSNSRKEL